jgi:excisionase family DNA binding protein
MVNILEDELLSVEQVARVLGVSPDTVRRYVRQKKLKGVRLSKTNLRIRRSEVERFIKERETDQA